MLYNRSPYQLLLYSLTMLPTHEQLPINVIKRNTAMNWLIEHFPKAFCLTNRKPLKLDILQDIIARAKPSTPNTDALELAIAYYTEWGSYLNALVVGANRVDLDGLVCGFVDQKSELAAKEKLKHAEMKLASQA